MLEAKYFHENESSLPFSVNTKEHIWLSSHSITVRIERTAVWKHHILGDNSEGENIHCM